MTGQLLPLQGGSQFMLYAGIPSSGSAIARASPAYMETESVARKNVEAVCTHLAQEFGRTSLDGKGGSFGVVVHAEDPTNAFWSLRDNRIEIGDGDGNQFGSFAQSPSVIAHELYHGVIDSEVKLDYDVVEQAAVHESLADVFAASMTGSWKIAADIYTPNVAGDALRDLAHPAIQNARDSAQALGEAHALSGIASLAAVRSAEVLGTGAVGKLWYRSLVDYLPDGADFEQLALATTKAAASEYGPTSRESIAVRDAWASVGILA